MLGTTASRGRYIQHTTSSATRKPASWATLAVSTVYGLQWPEFLHFRKLVTGKYFDGHIVNGITQ
jgi:hypothetical protein